MPLLDFLNPLVVELFPPPLKMEISSAKKCILHDFSVMVHQSIRFFFYRPLRLDRKRNLLLTFFSEKIDKGPTS